MRELLARLADGTIQIPEFQREPVVTDDWVISLIASVSLHYPIGAVMLLRAGSRDARFDARPVTGAQPGSEPEWFLVDGQRRLTVLYDVLTAGRGGRFHLDIDKALDPMTDRDEAIGVGDGSPAGFPLTLTFGSPDDRRRWLDAAGVSRLERDVLAAFDEYAVPVIRLGSDTTRWTVRVHGGPHGRRLSDRFSRRARPGGRRVVPSPLDSDL